MRAKFMLWTIVQISNLAGAAVAAPILITHERSGTSGTPAPNAPIVLQAFASFNSPSERVSLTIPAVPADPMERIMNYDANDGLSRSWVISAADAATYGLDWNAFAANLNGEAAQIAFGLGSAGFFKSPWSGPGTLAGFQLNRIEIDLDYYFWHPVLTSLRAYRIEARVFGDARIVPEPSAWLLAAIAVGSALGRFARRARR